jgi:hypothetical protein
MASRKALRLSNQSAVATFTAVRATAQWNHRVSKAASVGGLFHFPFAFSPSSTSRLIDGEVYLVGGSPQAAFRYLISAPCTEPV